MLDAGGGADVLEAGPGATEGLSPADRDRAGGPAGREAGPPRTLPGVPASPFSSCHP